MYTNYIFDEISYISGLKYFGLNQSLSVGKFLTQSSGQEALRVFCLFSSLSIVRDHIQAFGVRSIKNRQAIVIFFPPLSTALNYL